ncbi:MAG: hypothetical protein AAGH41_13495 [Pseudomonadota bacterium]
MVLIGRLFAWLALVAGLATAGWEAFTLHRFPDTSREVRFTGWGETPDVCSQRIAEHFEPMREGMTTIAEAIVQDPNVTSTMAWQRNGALDTFEVDRKTDQSSPDDEANGTSSNGDLTDEEEAEIRAAWEGIFANGVPVRPFWFRTLEDGRVAADTFGICGYAPLEWIGIVGFARYPSLKVGGFRARLIYEFKSPQGELPQCDASIPVKPGEFFGACVTSLGGEWSLVQLWEDYCSWLNALGFPKPGDENFFPGDEEYYGSLPPDATPCKVFGR